MKNKLGNEIFRVLVNRVSVSIHSKENFLTSRIRPFISADCDFNSFLNKNLGDKRQQQFSIENLFFKNSRQFLCFKFLEVFPRKPVFKFRHRLWKKTTGLPEKKNERFKKMTRSAPAKKEKPPASFRRQAAHLKNLFKTKPYFGTVGRFGVEKGRIHLSVKTFSDGTNLNAFDLLSNHSHSFFSGDLLILRFLWNFLWRFASFCPMSLLISL